MADILDALQARLRPMNGSLTVAATELAAAPFASFVSGLAGGEIVLSDVQATGGTITAGPAAGERTLSLSGVIASLPLPGRTEAIESLAVVVEATAVLGATSLSSAGMTVSSARLTLSTPGGGTLALDLSGSLSSTLALSGTATDAALAVNDAAWVATAGQGGTVVGDPYLTVAAALFQPIPVSAASVAIGTAPGTGTMIGLSLALGSWQLLNLPLFALDDAILEVTGSCRGDGASVGVGAILSATLEVSVAKAPTRVGVSLEIADTGWTLAVTPPAGPTDDDVIDGLAALYGSPLGASAFLHHMQAALPTVTQASVTFDLSAPGSIASIDLQLSATWLGATFLLGLSVPSLTLTLMMPENPGDPAHQGGVSLQKVVDGLTPITPSWIASELSFADVVLDGLTVVLSEHAFDVTIVVSTGLHLTVAGVTLAFTAFELSAAYDSGGLTASLGGTATIGTNALTVEASVTRGTEGWRFALDATEGTPAKLGDLLADVTQALGLTEALPVPSGPITVDVVNASFVYDSASSEVDLACDITATVTVLGATLSLPADLSFETEVTGGTRSYVFAATIPWTLGQAAMQLSYTYDSSQADPENVLCGWWAETNGGGVTIDDLLDAFGLDPPAGVTSFLGDLALDGVYLAFDFDAVALTLAAKATLGADAGLWFLLDAGDHLGQQPDQKGFNFVIGVGLGEADSGRPVTLCDLPVIGKDVPPLLAEVGLEAACIVVATSAPPPSGYAFPDLPVYGETDPGNPFVLLDTAAAGQIPFVAATDDDLSILAAASLVLEDLGGQAEPMATLSRLLSKASGPDLRPSVLLQASVAVGPGPVSVAFEVELEGLTLSLPPEKPKTQLSLSPSGLSFSVEDGNVALAIFGTMSFTLTLRNDPITLSVEGAIAILVADTGVEIDGNLNLTFAEGKQQWIQIPDMNLGIASLGVQIGIDPTALEVTFGADGSIIIPEPAGQPADELALVVGVDAEGIPNLQGLLITVADLDLGLIANIFEVTSGPAVEIASFADKVFAMHRSTLAWADQPVQLPDGKWIDAGFELCTGITILMFKAWMNVVIDVAAMTYQGTIQTERFTVGPPGAQLKITGKSKAVHVDGALVLAGGGPEGTLSTTTPFVVLTAHVEIDGFDAMDLDLSVTQKAINFHFDLHLPSPIPKIHMKMRAAANPPVASGKGDVILSDQVLKSLGLPASLLHDLGSVVLTATMEFSMDRFGLELRIDVIVAGLHGHAKATMHAVPKNFVDFVGKLVMEAIKNAST